MTDYERGYHQGYADAMNWKTQNHLEHLPGRQRPWVGLTDEEVQYIADSEYEEAFVRLVETKLRDKNT